MSDYSDAAAPRRAPADLSSDEFRAAGHRLVDMIADYLASLRGLPVTRGQAPRQIRDALGRGGLPAAGRSASELFEEVAPLLFEHSLHNGHPRFMAYITSSAAPVGMLADLLAAALNANLGRWDIAPLASEIEGQTVRWLAELVGFPADCGGIMVSGGNMANIQAFIAARKAAADWDIRTDGLYGSPSRLVAYATAETHTWIEKAADICGLGTGAIHLIATDARQRMRPELLGAAITADRQAGRRPFLVVGTAGSTGTGAIDPLTELSAIAQREGLWMHVDGAYGAFAAALPEASADLRALGEADSVALDPHKWLYAPLEAACVLVRDSEALAAAFSYLPSYYKLDRRTTEGRPVINYYNLGMQNSRGFRALKVWLGLRHTGRDGVVSMIREDIELARTLHRLVGAHPELEARTQSLSITTFRYRPPDLAGDAPQVRAYLNDLNQRLLDELQLGGEVFLSNAVVADDYLLRACIVNFRTSPGDIEAVPEIVAALGRRLDRERRSAWLEPPAPKTYP